MADGVMSWQRCKETLPLSPLSSPFEYEAFIGEQHHVNLG